MRDAPTHHSEPEFLTPAQAASEVGVTGQTISRLIHAGTFREVYRIGKSFKISRAAFEEYRARACVPSKVL